MGALPRWTELRFHAVLGRCVRAASQEQAVRHALAREIAHRPGWELVSLRQTSSDGPVSRWQVRHRMPHSTVRWLISVVSGASPRDLGFANETHETAES